MLRGSLFVASLADSLALTKDVTTFRLLWRNLDDCRVVDGGRRIMDVDRSLL